MLILFNKDLAPQLNPIEEIISQNLIILNNIPEPKDKQEMKNSTVSRESLFKFYKNS